MHGIHDILDAATSIEGFESVPVAHRALKRRFHVVRRRVHRDPADRGHDVGVVVRVVIGSVPYRARTRRRPSRIRLR